MTIGGLPPASSERSWETEIAEAFMPLPSLSWFFPDCERPCQPQAQLVDRFAAGLRRAQAHVERKAVAKAPDRADERRVDAGAPSSLLCKELRDRASLPRVRSFQ